MLFSKLRYTFGTKNICLEVFLVRMSRSPVNSSEIENNIIPGRCELEFDLSSYINKGRVNLTRFSLLYYYCREAR